MDQVYEMSKSLPNKWLNPDGSITDGQGNIISPASETGKAVYKSSKSFVNKFVDTDGEIKTQAQISMDIFTPVDKLPNGTFDEYYWLVDQGKWEMLGNVALDLSNYPTFDQMNEAIDSAVYDVLGGAY